jgi:Swt1-like HEPN
VELTTMTNHERVGRALALLKEGMPYVEREMRAAYGDGWIEHATASFPAARRPDIRDIHALLATMSNNWRSVFGKKLGRREQSIVNEVRTVRNDWAHQETFSDDDTYRALDSAERLLRAIASETEASAIEPLRLDLRREMVHPENRDSESFGSRTVVTKSPAKLTSAKAIIPGAKGKYRPLYDHLMRTRNDMATMSFTEIEQILGGSLAASARKYQAWWGNEIGGSHVHAKAWMEAGFHAHLELADERVTFERVPD